MKEIPQVTSRGSVWALTCDVDGVDAWWRHAMPHVHQAGHVHHHVGAATRLQHAVVVGDVALDDLHLRPLCRGQRECMCIHIRVCMCIYFIGPFFLRQQKHPIKVNQQGAAIGLLFRNNVIGQPIASTNQLSSCPEGSGVEFTWPHLTPPDPFWPHFQLLKTNPTGNQKQEVVCWLTASASAVELSLWPRHHFVHQSNAVTGKIPKQTE